MLHVFIADLNGNKHAVVLMPDTVPNTRASTVPKVSKNYTFPRCKPPDMGCEMDDIRQLQRRPAVIRRISRAVTREQSYSNTPAPTQPVYSSHIEERPGIITPNC